MRTSKILQEKYSYPIYGSESGIRSFNFENWTWYQLNEDGIPQDPYKLLLPIFEDIPAEELENFITDSRLADGGAAMTAYAKMQFMEMSDLERERRPGSAEILWIGYFGDGYDNGGVGE